MKMSLVLVLSLGPLSAFASDAGNFDAHKKRTLNFLDQRIEIINQAKKCISASLSQNALKACKQKMMEDEKNNHHQEMKKKKEEKK